MDDDEMITVRVRALELARFGLDMDRAADDVRKPGHAARETEGDFARLFSKMDVLGRLQKTLKPAAIVTGIGAIGGAISTLAAGAVALGGALAPASGALAAYPALGLAGAQGLGVFKLATTDVFKAVGGLNSKLEENSSAFKKLSPEGQRFARVLDSLKAPFRELPTLAQKAMLPGFTAGLRSAAGDLKIFRPLIVATGGALGQFAQRAGALLGSKGFGKDLQTIGLRNVSWMRQGGTIVLNLADALRHLLIASGPLVSWLVHLAVGWSRSADQMARTGRQTGTLAAFFGKTRTVLSQLLSIGGSFVGVLFNIGRAGAPLGNSLLGIIRRNAKAFAQWTGSAAGQNKIARFFAQAKAPLIEAGRLIKAITVDFFKLGSGNQGGLATLLRTLRVDLLPVLYQVLNGTTKAFGPTFVKTIADIAKAFAPMLGSSGPLILFVETLDTFAKITLTVEKAVPGAAGVLFVLANAMALMAHVGMARFVSQMFGVNRGIATMRSGFASLRSGLDTAKLGTDAMRLAFVAQGGAADASNLSVLRAVAAAKLSALWSRVVGLATKAWAGAQWLLNAAMEANPIVLIITAIAALGAALYLAYTKVSWFRNGVNAAFHFVASVVSSVVHFIGKHWSLILALLMGPVGLAVRFIVQHFDGIVGFFAGLPGRIAHVASGMFNGIVGAFKSALDLVIGLWDKLGDLLTIDIGSRHIGPLKLPGIHLRLLPKIPALAQGGTAMRGGAALVGDAGPEIINMPQGASVHPLGAGNGDDLAEKIASAIARRMPTRPLVFHMDHERVGHGVLRWLDDQAATAG